MKIRLKEIFARLDRSVPVFFAIFFCLPAFGQDFCDLTPGGDPHILRGAIQNPLTMSGDPFLCGLIRAPTPATCSLFNRVYTDQESSCVNREQGSPPPDYLPYAYGPDLRSYEADKIILFNWAQDLGSVFPTAKNWFLLWDLIQDANTPVYIGFYAAQADLVVLGEFGNPRSIPCSQGATSGSCMELERGSIANQCKPVGTPLGTIENIGALAAVPVPILLSVLADSALGYADPTARIALEWVPACAQTQGIDSTGFGGTAPEPIMGYRMEVFVDRDANGLIDTASGSGWDPLNRAVNGGCENDSFVPLFDIAPMAGDISGNRLTKTTVVNIADFSAPGGVFENPAQIEALTFRLRILYRDDRFASPPGGKDMVIDPVCSAPSAMGGPIANSQIFGGAAGAVPDGNVFPGTPLQVAAAAGGSLELTWGSSCNAGDSDFAVYEGVLGDFQSHTQKLCTTGGATSASFTPDPGNRYFLVVPKNSQVEGSYGLRSDGSERPRAVSACVGQQNIACSGTVLSPDAITDPVTGVTALSAILNGRVNPNGFLASAFFDWGPTPLLGGITPAIPVGEGTGLQAASFSLTGLSPNTTYHFRIVGENGIGTTAGTVESFTTATGLIPAVTTGQGTNVTINSATLNGIVNPDGLATAVQFEWGLTPAFGNVTPNQDIGDGTADLPVSADLTGLLPGTVYHFRLVASNTTGTGFGLGETFQTTIVLNDLVANGGFDNTPLDPFPWVVEGDFFVQFDPDVVRSGLQLAVGGVASGTDTTGKNNAAGRIYQDVTIPSNATTATLSFWHNITSNQPELLPSDFLQVNILDTSDVLLLNLQILDNTDLEPLGVWTESLNNLIGFAGQTIRLEFVVQSNATQPTIFRLEDVTLMADGS